MINVLLVEDDLDLATTIVDYLEIEGFTAGSDDYLVKPFAMQELFSW